MPPTFPSAAPTRVVRNIPIDLVHPGPQQARRWFDPDALKELARSILESGVVQPVVVRTNGSGYEILAGERRWRASQIAGIHEIPAVVRDDLSDSEAYVLGLIENLQRESLTPMEAAYGLKQLGDYHDLTHEEIAERLGKSRTYVTNYLRLLGLTPKVQEMLNKRELSMGHARVLASADPKIQDQLAREVVKSKLSVRSLERRYAQFQKSGPVRTAAGKSRELAELERKLTEHLGNKVEIDYDEAHAKGEIKVTFHGLDEFEGIVGKWGYKGK